MKSNKKHTRGKNLVQWQKVKEIQTKPCGESSPYWDYAIQKGEVSDVGYLMEDPRANPDVLSDNETQETYFERATGHRRTYCDWSYKPEKGRDY